MLENSFQLYSNLTESLIFNRHLVLSIVSPVDLCRPLLVGILPTGEEADGEGQEGKRMVVFLRVKHGVLVEVDPQRGVEMSRLELDSLARVQTTQAIWTPQVSPPPVPLCQSILNLCFPPTLCRTVLWFPPL